MGACFCLRGAVPLRPHGCSLMRPLGPGNRAATYGVDRPAELAAFTSTASGLLASLGGGPGPPTLGWGLAPAARQRALPLSALRRGLAASALRLIVEKFGIGTVVGWALAVVTGAPSALPDLRIWWRRPPRCQPPWRWDRQATLCLLTQVRLAPGPGGCRSVSQLILGPGALGHPRVE